MTPIVSDNAMEKMEKQLNLWIEEMTTEKNCSRQYWCEAESQRTLQSHTQSQESIIPFLAGAGWLAHFKGQHSMKNAKFALEAGSEDQEIVEEF